MNDYRAAGQELPGQVLAAARKGQERVSRSVKTAAQQIRPQLANLSRPTFSVSALPSPAQLREKAPEFVAKLPGRLPARLQPMLPNRLPNRVPSPEQLRTSAQEFAGHARSVQRLVADQVRSVATPLAHQAAARLSQVGGSAPGTSSAKTASKTGTTTRVSQVTVSKASGPTDKPADKPSTTGKSSRSGSTAATGEPAKPKTGPAKTGPAKTDPAKTGPAKTDPAKTSPAKTSQPKPGAAKPKTGPADK